MKALLLAAGLGTRLKPFTFLQSKASLPFLNAPLIHYPLQYLSANGISEIIINLHAHPDSVQQAAGNQFGTMPLRYSHEPQIMGTAGAMAKASTLLGNEPFVVINSDMVSDIPLAAVVEHHQLSGNLVTLVVMDAEQIPGYSSLFFDSEILKLTGIREGSGMRCHYSGLQIVDPAIIQRIPADRKTEIFQDVYPALMQEGRIGGVLYDGLWFEMGSLAEFLKSALKLLNTPLPAHLCPPRMQATLVSPAAKIDAGANVAESI
ncbi:NTP transferase domain-containing protein, partial [bacterium]|nr:NTP transferase domain-containing protein [bacterium]